MALSANRSVDIVQGTGVPVDWIVTSGVTVWQGGLYSILISTGKVVVPTSASASTVQQFCGIALEKCIGDGTKRCCFMANCMFWHALGSGAITDIGKKVYSASDSDDTLTLTGTVNVTQCMGTIVNFESASRLLIAAKPFGVNIDAVS